VWTAGYRGSRPLDVLVEDDRIAEVASAGTLNTDGAEVHDLDGRLLTPGFQDAHIHLGIGGSDLLTCNLADLETPEQIGTGLGLSDHLEAYGELLKNGDLRLRLTTALWWDQKRGLEQIPEIQARREELENIAGPDRVIADTVKVMVDGADVLFMDADKIRDATVALDRLGFTVHYHSYGDASTRWILDAIETAIRENGPRVRRHHIAHLFVVAEEEFARFAQLGVTANVQGFWAGSSVPHDHIHDSTSTDHGESLEYPFGRLQAAGALLAGGSDWPVTTPDPLVCARTAHGDYIDPDLRKDLTELDRLDPVAMLTAYTAGSAFVNGRGATTGRIAEGFLADLVVLDRDVFASDDALRHASVSEVWIGGQRLFSQA
jgi:predicted amidohydrolase YtcJ